MFLPVRRVKSAVVLIVAALGIFWAPPVFPQSTPDQLLFGPKQYLRTTGAPNQYSDTFSVPTADGAPFLLHIVNGDGSGGHMISDATIVVNGVQVAGPNDFSQQVTVVDRTVTLTPPSNTLNVQVTVGSIPGSYLTISVYGTKILPTPTALTPNPLTIRLGATGTLTATLAPTPTTSGTLTVSSDNTGVATVPASVSFASGQSSVQVYVTSVSVGHAQITVSLNGGSASSTVQVTPPPPTVTSLSPATLTITQGGSGTLTVTISAAQTSDTTVTLSSTDSGIASVPGSVIIPAMQTSVPITVSANTLGTVQITASLNGTNVASLVTVTPALPTVVSLLPPTNPVTLGATTTLTVTIYAAQPTDTTVTVTATPSGIVTVPATVTVPAGQTSASIAVGTQALGTALVTASLNGTSADAAVQVLPPAPALVSLLPSPLTVVVNAPGTLTVTLNEAPLANTTVTLTVDHSNLLQVPASVTVPMNQRQASFTVMGLAVGDAVVTASLNASTQTATVHVIQSQPTVVSLLPNPLAIQQGATGSFTLTINATQPSDTVVPLTNSAPSVLQAPASVTVPAGQTNVTFPVIGLILGSATVSASINSTSANATVQVTQPPTLVTALTPASSTVPKGTPAVLHVSVSPASTQPETILLTSSNTTAATVPATVPIPAGALGADFPVLSVSEGSATITASLNGGSASATVVVTAAQLVTLTVSPQTPTTLYVGQTEPFTATGTFTDGTTQDLTTSVTWSSSNQTVATINASGVASALAAGTTTITATSGSISASTTLTVLTPPALSLSPASATLRVGDSLTFTVTSAAPAGTGGLTVTLTQSGSGRVTMPASVVIPEGQSSATFTVTGSSAGSVTITATAPIRLPASSTLTITLTLPPPTLTGFTPSQGKAGTNVTITGQNFDPVLANNQVKFNGVSAAVLSATSTMLIATVPPTASTGPITVTTGSGTAQSATNFIVVPITAFSVTPALATLPSSATQQVRAIASFGDGTTLDVTSFTTWVSSNSGVASVTSGGLAQGAAQGTATITGSLGTLSGSASVRVIAASGGPLPPDPSLVASPIDRTVATTLGAATAFLYTGSNPIQTGVAPGTIIATHVAVLRGLVSGRDGYPIPAVTITVLGHPEFGQTGTRPDGMFDLAVNGGSLLTVKYDKAGYLSSQRQVQAPWQDYARLPDVVLIALDAQVTSVDLTSPNMQTARGSAVTDLNGTRQATVLFPSGTTAVMTLPGGTTQSLTTLSVRATEYTVGATGPQAMPALLPQTSNYTYAVEFSVDQAQAANATKVQFSQPVISYLENFLVFPVGKAVPAGSYDRVAGQWAPAPSGRVIKILSISGGLANVDTDGDGVADNGLGMTTAEQQQLASLYTAGTSLWRVPVDHFTTWDYNWILRLPLDAIAPVVAVQNASVDACRCQNPASLLRIQNQVVDESNAVTGTPFRLHYTSERAAGYRAAYNVVIPLTGASVPASLKRVELAITVAGQRFLQTFSGGPNQQYLFPWDGTDAYGRRVQGRQTVQVRIGYVYNANYQENSRFAEIGGGSGTSGAALVPPIVTGELSRFEVTVSRTSQFLVGPLDLKALGFGGWSLNVHHAYDTSGRKLYLGDGSRRSTESVQPTITTAATDSDSPFWMAVGPDGSVYWALPGSHLIRKRAPDGTITTVAGNGTAGYGGDGFPATAAQLSFPYGVTLGADGSLYISDSNNNRIRRVDPSGIITTFAGGGGVFPGDNGPATQGVLATPRGLAVGPDGSLYIADTNDARIRRVGPDGIITTVAGGGGVGWLGDGMPATQTALNFPTDVAVGPDGSLYIVDAFNYAVRRVGLDGIIQTVAGRGGVSPGDGFGATAVFLNYPQGVAVGPDGTLYITEQSGQRVRRVTPDGIITTVAGTGTQGFSGDGGPAPQATLKSPTSVAVGPDGSLYVGDTGNVRVRKVAPPLPGFVDATYVIPSEDGTEAYAFNTVGKHLRTHDALTGAVKYQFAYDGNGLLASVTDVAGQVTTIERDGSGNPTAIVAPGGQRTTLSVDGNGYLASLTNPNSEMTQVTSSGDGLLATLTDPRSNLRQYTYDTQGRLTNDQDPAGGFTTLARTDLSAGWKVTPNTALNRTSTNQVTTLAIGDQLRTDTDPSGLVTTTQIGNGTTTLTAPDGTITTQVSGADPRFGMLAPITKSLTVRLPSGLTSTLTTTRTAGFSPNDPLSLTSQTDTLVINGRTYTSAFTQSTKQIVTTTPANRTSTVTLDAQGRVVQEQVTGLEPVSYTYDALGRLSTITQGTGTTARTSTLGYNAENELTGIQDPLSRTVGFSYDLAGRITTQTLPDLRQIQYSYDANGNVTSITPPGRSAHAFTYTPVDLESNYDPPNAGFSPKNTQYTYNLDRQLTLVTRPDGQTLGLGYDTGGRLSTLTLPGSLTITYAYDPTKGTLNSITAPNSTLSYTYDGSLLTQTTWAGTVAGSVSRVYDTNFRISSQSVNGGNTISFGYDNDSLSTSAGAETITRSAQNGLITGTTVGVVTDSRSYSTFGELGGYTANVSGSPVFSVTYTRDKLGRITQKVETIGGSTNTFIYTYDTAGRLIDVNLNGATAGHYTYDSNGNRLSHTDATSTVNGTYDAQDRLTNYGNLQYTYTTNGELLTKTNPVLGQTATFTYDVLGNLKTASLPGGTTVDYVIDGQNRRIGKKVNGVLTQGFLYQNQLNPVAELDGTGNIVSRFVYGTKANVPDYMIKGGVTYRIVSDHLGSPRLIVNTTDGTAAQRIDYDEFGNITADTNPGFQPFGFEGGLYDQHTGLTRFGFRDYDAQIGRWTAKDPIKLGGGDANLYGYLVNDPINLVDPTGLWSTEGHNYFIDEYFTWFLPAPYIDQIKAGSRYADSLKFQGPDYAFMHAMSSSTLSKDEARAKMCEYVKGAMIVYSTSGDPNVAFWYLGLALHPVMDSTSPVHRGFQQWHGRDFEQHGGGPLAPLSREDINVAPQYGGETLALMSRVLHGDYSGCGCGK